MAGGTTTEERLMELLRFATAGSVDDGKSTLIGRLLLDTKQIFEDQLEAVERTSRDRGFDYTNLALLTDGLRAEREQGITIDVAYRYFATPKRKFIIADTPGHVQYTRNMVTGASTADLALVLIDARKGVLEQSRRHSVIASLLQVKHLVLCVNKMDLVEYSQERFDEICDEFTEFAAKLDFDDLTFIPISALHGDNVTSALAEHALVRGADAAAPPRARLHRVGPQPHRRAVPGAVRDPPDEPRAPRLPRVRRQVASGMLRPGDEVVVLPSGFTTTIAGDRRVRRPDRRGGAADVGERAPRRRHRRQPRRHDRAARTTCRPSPRTSTRWCAGSTSSRCATGATYAVKHTTRTGEGTRAAACTTGST